MPLEIRLLAPSDNLVHFDCGNEDLNLYFKTQALGKQHNQGTTWVALDGGQIVALLTVSAQSLKWKKIPSRLKDKIDEKYHTPVVLLARMGVDNSRKNSGIGSRLIVETMKLAREQRKLTGCMAITVCPKTGVSDYYKKNGFEEMPDSKILILSLDRLESDFEKMKEEAL